MLIFSGFPRFIVYLIFFLTLSGCQAPQSDPFDIAVHPWIGYQSLTLCQQNDKFVGKNINVVSTSSLSESAKLLKDGSVDAAALTLDEVLALREGGVALTIVLIFDSSVGADLILSRKSINSLQELAGKTIGMENSFHSRLLLSEALKRAGINQDQVYLEFSPVNHHEDAWNKGNLDALVTYLPLSEQILDETKTLFDSHEIPNTILDVLAVRTSSLNNHKDEIRYLIKQHFDVIERIDTNSQDVLYRLSQVLQMPVAEIRDVLYKLNIPGPLYNNRLLQPDSTSLNKTLTKLSGIMLSEGFLSKPVSREGLTNASFLP